MKSRISGKEAVYVARESERRRPVKLLASDRVDGVSVKRRVDCCEITKFWQGGCLRGAGE